MDRLDAMKAFLAVSDLGGFAPAARHLRMSAAGVTRAVALLEADLGLALLARTTRVVRLTERGALYAERCRRILAEVDEARGVARGESASPFGRLAITAPVVFGRLHILPVVERMSAAYPDLVIRLTLLDRVVHLVEEGFDLAVRIGDLPDSSFAASVLTRVRPVLVASPGYLAEHGTPQSLADLKRHRIIGFESVGATNDWRFGSNSRMSVTVSPMIYLNSADAAIASCQRGVGITRALDYQVEAAIAEGRLVRILEAFEPADVPVSLLYQSTRRGSPNIRAFVIEARRMVHR